MLEALIAELASIEDPRCGWKVEHRLIDILVIAVCAVLGEAETFEDIALYGRCKEAWLGGFLALPNGIPSHDTFRRVFTLIDPEAFERSFLGWVRAVFRPEEAAPRQVAIDGKTVRRSFDRKKGRSPLHLVSAYATEGGLVLAQRAAESKGGELAAVPDLLDGLDLRGCLVRTCREFRVWAGMIGAKEPRHAATQRAKDTRRHPRPAAGRRRSEDGVRPERPTRWPEEGLGRAGAERRDGPPPHRRGRNRQQPQRLWPEERPHRHRQDRARGAAGPAGELRPAADRQVPAPLSRLRRQDRLDVRPRHEHPGDRRPPARALRHRGLARPGQRGDRRGAGRGRGLAGAAAGGRLSLGLLRRPAGEDP